MKRHVIIVRGAINLYNIILNIYSHKPAVTAKAKAIIAHDRHLIKFNK